VHSSKTGGRKKQGGGEISHTSSGVNVISYHLKNTFSSPLKKRGGSGQGRIKNGIGTKADAAEWTVKLTEEA